MESKKHGGMFCSWSIYSPFEMYFIDYSFKSGPITKVRPPLESY